MATSDEHMAQLVKQLKKDPGMAEQLPGKEGTIVRNALSGQTVYEIAQNYRMSEEAVWGVLRSAARSASGQKIEPVESGGLGSDTDPGITGGYGDTGFGSLDVEPEQGG
ncbi:MAG: hypothetical protein JWP00_447 [Chloroflexi bacterium]|jgi:hypothetical protein|nr:hypothetical protein [Chloroflexota bacterium]